jgi:DegV family protein with EDD domain
MAAARSQGGLVHMVDSLGASLLEGMLALKAAELAELGTPPDEIVAELRRVRTRSGIFFTVDELDRLLASGRVSRGRALVGRALGLKPILGLHPDGSVAVLGKALGTPRARATLLRILRKHIPADVQRVRFGVVHVGVPEVVEGIARQLRAEYGEHVEILVAPATPVIATHTGIGTVGIAFLVEG